MIVLLVGLLAAAAAPDARAAWLADAATLTLSDDLVAIEGLVARAGPGTLRMQRGVGRAVVSGAAPGGAPARVVGVVVAGTGQAHVSIPDDPATATAWANRIVGWLGGDRARGDALVAGHGLAVAVTRAVILAPEVADQLGAPVTIASADDARADLAATWSQRVALAPAELAPDRAVAWDRFRDEVLGAPPDARSRWWDAHTDQPWGALEPDRARTQPTPGDGWLAVMLDPDGALDGVTRALAYTAGIDTLGRPGRLPLATWRGDGPPPLEVADSAAHVVAEAAPDGLLAEVTARVTLHARAPQAAVVLRVPADATALTVAAAGAPLELLPLGATGRSRWVAVAPPGGVAPAAPVALTVGWQARWPTGGLPETTGPQRFLPGLVPDRLGSPARFTLAVDAPEGWATSATGTTQAGGVHAGDGAWPRVVLTRGPVDEAGETPRVRVTGSAHPGTTQAEVAALLGALARITDTPLPDELDVVALPPGLRAGETSGGMVALQARILDDLAGRRGAEHARPVLAHELAHLTWGHATRPATVADRWLAEVLAEVTAELALDDLAGGGTLPGRLARHLRVARTLDPLPLPAAWGGADARGHLYHAGPAVLLGPLRRRIGEGALREGLRCAAREPTLSSAGLRQCFEAASGADLGDFWAFWIDGGQVPAVSGTWSTERSGRDATRVTVHLSADVPYGRFTVPVGVVDRRGRVLAEAAATLVDGVGTLTLGPVQAGRVEAVLDPHGDAIVRQGAWAAVRR